MCYINFTEYAKTVKMTGQLLAVLTLWTAKHRRNIYKLQIAEIGVYTGYAGSSKTK